MSIHDHGGRYTAPTGPTGVDGDRYGQPGCRYIGFWRSKSNEVYAVELPNPAAFIYRGCDPAERAQVLEYLRAAPFVEDYLGSSYCRICGKSPLGYREHGDGAFVWPEGFAHYVEEHWVKPPEEIPCARTQS
ncbi:MAG TPA: hypothetical protein VFV45_05075 [Rubrobacteraceae bacterium]|nr:hypothetical protein [Rubrobacteraceae bacterium]